MVEEVGPSLPSVEDPGTTIPLDDEVIFERQVAVAFTTLNRALLHDAKLERSDLINFTANELTLRLEKLIYATRLGRLEVSYPDGPWETFRATHFPRTRLGRWFLRRRPVRETTVVKSAYAAFPEAHIAWPDKFGPQTIIFRTEPVGDN